MADVVVTRHAVIRAIERIPGIRSEEQARALILAAVTKSKAIEFGAHYVRLPGRQRIVLEGHRVITVLPSDHAEGRLSAQRYVFRSLA